MNVTLIIIRNGKTYRHSIDVSEVVVGERGVEASIEHAAYHLAEQLGKEMRRKDHEAAS